MHDQGESPSSAGSELSPRITTGNVINVGGGGFFPLVDTQALEVTRGVASQGRSTKIPPQCCNANE